MHSVHANMSIAISSFRTITELTYMRAHGVLPMHDPRMAWLITPQRSVSEHTSGNFKYTRKSKRISKHSRTSSCQTRHILERPHYLSRVDHERKIRSRRQRTDIGKYSFVNRTIQHWNQSLAEVLGILPCKPITFKKRVRKVIIELNWNEVKCAGNHKNCREAESSEVKSLKWNGNLSNVVGSEVQ